MKKVFIATYPFGLCGDLPVKLLEETGWHIEYNSLGRRLKGNEVKDMLQGFHAVIAGTEPYNEETLSRATDLEVISRVGIGLDSVDFYYCRKNNIAITFTPEAPSDSVADLTVAQIINLLRGVHISDKSVRDGRWQRTLGLLIKEVKIGILGVGRIGGRVVNRLRPFEPKKIYACDLEPKEVEGVEWVDKDTLFRESDVVSIHIPLNERNFHFVGLKEMTMMKEGSYFINTSRGAVVNESDLESCIHNKHFAGAALDVFEKEPYEGSLTKYDNVLLTAHIGASARQSRFLMELGAAQDCIRFLKGEPPENLVTEEDVR